MVLWQTWNDGFITPQQQTKVSLKGRFLDLDLRCGKASTCGALMGKRSSVKIWSLCWGRGGTGREWGEKINYFYALKVAGTCSLSLLHNHLTYIFFFQVLDIWEKHYFSFFKNRWRLLVTTPQLRVSSLFGIYMGLVKYIPLMNWVIFWNLSFLYHLQRKVVDALIPCLNNHALEVK